MMKAKKMLKLSAVLLALFLVGCSSGERRRVSREMNSLTAAYEVKMDKGETTRDQDQRFIRAASKVAYQMDRSLRGEKKANKTRKAAKKLAQGGVDPDSDFNLDDDEKDTIRELKAEVVDLGQSGQILKDIEELAKDVSKAVGKQRKGK